MPSVLSLTRAAFLRHATQAVCLGALGMAAPLAAQNASAGVPTPEIKKILDGIQARGVHVKGEMRVTINGQTVVLKDNVAQLSTSSVLRWRNGESLTGELAGVKDGTLLWHSPLFTEPLALDLAVLQGAEFPDAPGRSEDPFVLKLRDGSRLFGTPVSLEGNTLKFQSTRHGEVPLQLGEVVSLQRMRGAGLIYRGPDTPEGWQSPGLSDWRMHNGGAFATHVWNRTTRLNIDLPQKVDMLIRLSSTAPPEFSITLGATDTPNLLLENWSGTLVLAQGSNFVPLMEIGSKTSFAVRLLWDRPAGRALAFTPEGDLLGELKPPSSSASSTSGSTSASSTKGLQLRNNGVDLTLDDLRIREWSGDLPGRLPLSEPHVQLTNGKVLTGKAAACADGRLTLSSGEAVPLDQLESLVTGVVSTATDAPAATHLAFSDGTRLVGKLQSVSDGKVAIQITASSAPVVSSIAGLQRMHLEVAPPPGAAAELPFGKQDKVTLGNITMHGRVLGSGTSQPRWLPVGGRSSVEAAPASQAAFTRVFLPETVTVSSALLYLKDGDVLPADVRAIDEHAFHVTSPLSTVRELPAAHVEAVQFNGRRVELKGFVDAGWRQLRGAATAMQRDANKATFRQASSLLHPNILQGDEVKFTLSAEEGWGALRMRVYTSGGEDPQGGIAFLVYLSGNELYGGQEADRGGDFAPNRQVQVRTNPGQPVNIRIALQEKQVELFANGMSLCKVALVVDPAAPKTPAQNEIAFRRGRGGPPPPPKVLGPGLVLETVSLWGNGEQPVSVRDFSVRANPMRPWMPAVDGKAKEQTLTLPRFRSDDPPTHALVALNGDVLRGRLEAATSEHLRILSGLEALTVPRDRIAAVIRLQPLDKPAPPPSSALSDPPAPAPPLPPTPSPSPSPPLTPPTHWLLLTDGGRFALKVERFDADKVIGTSLLLGRCEVPWDRINTVRFDAPEPTTAQSSYRDWKLKPAPEPVLPEDGGKSSPLIGKEVKDFKVPLLAGGDFDFARQRGKVVVLDFWATWCGPCIQSLPELMDTVKTLKDDKAVAEKFVFIAMNEAEPASQVKRFLEQRNWDLPVALDLLQNVGRQFQVEGIPHTVVIGPDGKIAWQNTGHRPGAAQELSEMVRKLANPESK